MSGRDDKLEEGEDDLVAADEDLGTGVSNLRVSGIFFKAVVQAVLIFSSETWIMTPFMERYLGSFQHRVVQRITGS